jgi:hypothetical protein
MCDCKISNQSQICCFVSTFSTHWEVCRPTGPTATSCGQTCAVVADNRTEAIGVWPCLRGVTYTLGAVWGAKTVDSETTVMGGTKVKRYSACVDAAAAAVAAASPPLCCVATGRRRRLATEFEMYRDLYLCRPYISEKTRRSRHIHLTLIWHSYSG